MSVKGSCHCKATQFEISAEPATVTSCTCSYCSKHGALWAYATPEQFKITTAPERGSVYQWNSFTVRHHYCAICGVATYSESPDWSTGKPDFDRMKIGFNARLFDDFDLAKVEVVTIDGKNLW